MKTSRADIRSSYVNLILSSLVGVLLLPFILRALSPAEVGIWYVMVAVGGLTVVLDFGFMTTMGRHVTYAWSGLSSLAAGKLDVESQNQDGPNLTLLKEVIRTARLLYLMITLLALLLMATAGTAYLASVGHGVIGQESTAIAWGVYVLATCIGIYFGYWTPVLRGVGGVRMSNVSSISGKIAQLLSTLVALWLGWGLVGVSLGYLLGALVFRVVSALAFQRWENLGDKLRDIPEPGLAVCQSHLRTMWPSAWRQGVASLSQYLHGALPVLIVSGMMGLEDAAIFGLTAQLVGVIRVAGNALYNAMVPAMVNGRVHNDIPGLRKQFHLAWGVSICVMGVGGVAMIVILPALLARIGSATTILGASVALVYVLMEVAVNAHMIASHFIQTGNQVPMAKAYLVTVVLTGLLEVVLLSMTHTMWVIAITPIVTHGVYNMWKWPAVVARELHESTLQLLSRSMREVIGIPRRLVSHRA